MIIKVGKVVFVHDEQFPPLVKVQFNYYSLRDLRFVAAAVFMPHIRIVDSANSTSVRFVFIYMSIF